MLCEGAWLKTSLASQPSTLILSRKWSSVWASCHASFSPSAEADAWQRYRHNPDGAAACDRGLRQTAADTQTHGVHMRDEDMVTTDKSSPLIWLSPGIAGGLCTSGGWPMCAINLRTKVLAARARERCRGHTCGAALRHGLIGSTCSVGRKNWR